LLQTSVHQVVTPSQVTCPGSPKEQLPSTPEQLVVLVSLLQLTEPPPAQVAATTQRDFSPRIAGRFATVTGAGPAREARKVLSVGAPCDPLAAVAGGTRKIRQARIIETPKTIFFMTISFLLSP
jgi:hypothetical protein